MIAERFIVSLRIVCDTKDCGGWFQLEPQTIDSLDKLPALRRQARETAGDAMKRVDGKDVCWECQRKARLDERSKDDDTSQSDRG